jgi:dihydroneopterin aldolase
VTAVVIEIRGLALRGYHGATEVERREGQTFLFDLELEASDAAVRSDELGDTVDYRDVVACVQRLSDGRRFDLLEALAGAVAEALVARFPVTRARVRVRKPEVRLGAPVEYTAATVERRASGDG